jgi:hypothetical protein
MAVDDPDHSDLNVLAPGMLSAGASYFGRPISEPELEVVQIIPDGQVKVGTATVVDSAPAKPSVRFPMRVSLSFGSDEPSISFNFPAGDAISTLRQFARKADAEIIYSSEQLRGIKTSAVVGELPPRVALDRLLEGTGLIAIPDEQGSAFVIRRSEGR